MSINHDVSVVILALPKSTREKLREYIERIQKTLKIEEDLFLDGRSRMWRAGGKLRERVKPKTHKAHEVVFSVSWRGGQTIHCTASEAAFFVNKTPSGLGLCVAHGGKYVARVGDEIITVKRL